MIDEGAQGENGETLPGGGVGHIWWHEIEGCTKMESFFCAGWLKSGPFLIGKKHEV